MRTDVYESLIRQSGSHWWFRARQKILLDLVESRREEIFPGQGPWRILDVGAGAGHIARAMTRFGEVWALEGVPRLLEVLRGELGLNTVDGFLPNESLSSNHFDFVTALDVLEHIEDDMGACREIHRVLKPSGHLLVTVPAHPFLWSDHDESHHHFRRYRPQDVGPLLTSSGFQVVFETPFQFYLFPALLLERVARRLAGRKGAGKEGVQPPPGPINRFLERVFSRESRRVSRGGRFPFGSSHLVLARKPGRA